MNESAQRELENLKQRQKSIEQQLTALAGDIQRLEKQFTATAGKSAPEPTATPAPATTIPQPISPSIPPIIRPPAMRSRLEEALACPAPKPTAEFVSAFLRPEPNRAEAPPQQDKEPPVPPLPTSPSGREASPSFELRLGTYWLVRIGAVLILTGLAFFGNLAYQKLGAGGKIGLLYLASGLLLGAGAWWQRKAAHESLHNFAQVLFAGGLAAVYFTTYAAHHVPALQVISSALLDGALLARLGGLHRLDRRPPQIRVARPVRHRPRLLHLGHHARRQLYALLQSRADDRRGLLSRAQSLGWFVVGELDRDVCRVRLVAVLSRRRRLALGTPDEGLGFGASFLFSYWLVFTVAAFLSKHENIAGNRRAAFITFNNGALFSLFVLTMLQVDTGRFWQFALGYGSVLLGLAELARRFLASEPITKNTYLTQGLVLVTVGLVAKFTGTQLALVLAAESVILFILGTLRKNIFLQTGAYISGAMSVGWGIDSVCNATISAASSSARRSAA
jgi:hypothetical protein